MLGLTLLPLLPYTSPPQSTIEIVVARYNEDLAWLSSLPCTPDRFTVYNKGPALGRTGLPPNTHILRLPNVGRCDHTYLHHIIANYDRLADVTVFLPGSATDPLKYRKATTVTQIACSTHSTVLIGDYVGSSAHLDAFKLDEWTATNAQNRTMNNEQALLKSPIRPFGRWFAATFGKGVTVDKVVARGVFAVSRQDILKNPKARYQALIRYLDHHSNPEAGHYMERAWATLFEKPPFPAA